jgi:diadenosine tetraphosphate (Ap4A) HIT family hydrolase
VQVATKLCLFAKEATTYYLDFWKLKRQYQLYQIYPEIQPYLPSFVKLFKELKKQGLNSQNVKWFVDGLNIGTIKIEDVYADFENLKANNRNLRNENENLRNENQNLRYENQELIRQIQYNKRMFENDSLAMQKHIADLSELSEQQQQNVDTLSERIEKLYNKEQKQKLVVSKFGDTNKKYRKIKNIVKEHVDELLKQTEQNQKAVLSIALISIIQALKDNPDKYNVIFNNNNTNECQQELVTIGQTFYRNLVDEHVSQTMALLESKAESESEGIEEDIASTETKAEAENIEAAAEEETKPEE